MTAPDDTAPADDAQVEEHINPATGYVETTAYEDVRSPDEAGPRTSPAEEDEEAEEHINPATGYVETTAHEERRPGGL